MKHVLIASLIIVFSCVGAMAQERLSSKIPNQVQSHFIFKSGEDVGGMVEIKGYPAFERVDENNVTRTGLDYKQSIQTVGELPQEVLELEAKAGRAVLKANFEIPVAREELQPDGSMRKVILSYTGNGSAVVVGKNYILTNIHVVDVLKTNKKPSLCPLGDLTSGEDPSLKVQCKSIVACGQTLAESNSFIDNSDDWCLIEVTPTANGQEIGEIIEPLKLTSGRKLKLGQKVATIGNPAGLGIQASWGLSKTTTSPLTKTIGSTAYSLSGNSGGALIDDEGRLQGLVYASESYDARSAYSLSTEHLIKRLSQEVSPDVLRELLNERDFLQAQQELKEEAEISCKAGPSQEAKQLKEPRKLSRWFKKLKRFIELNNG